MVRTKWVLRREDRDEYRVEDLGIFGDLESAFGYLKNYLWKEIEKIGLREIEEEWEEWLRDNNYNRRDHPFPEYIETLNQKIDRKIDKVRRRMRGGRDVDQGAEDNGLDWGVWFYSFNKVPDFS